MVAVVVWIVAAVGEVARFVAVCVPASAVVNVVVKVVVKKGLFCAGQDTTVCFFPEDALNLVIRMPPPPAQKYAVSGYHDSSRRSFVFFRRGVQWCVDGLLLGHARKRWLVWTSLWLMLPLCCSFTGYFQAMLKSCSITESDPTPRWLVCIFHS